MSLPSGTVTFLFTDIEGSTSLAQQFPAELPALLARHHAILHESIARHNGHVFQITGDAFCAAFYTAGDALKAALDAQRGLQHETWHPAPIKVRMGIHTGAAQAGAIEERAGGYVGYLTLTRVQRVMSTAYGGQVLLSNPTAELVRGELPVDVTLRDMGEHRLKGLLNPEHLWQMVAPDLRQDFPPLQSLNAIPNNLPVQLTSFVGREQELREVKRLLGEQRLVTLTGPGGTGKTRLALQAATDVLDDFEDRVNFVDLASSRDPESVLAAIARTVGLREKSDKPLLDDLKSQIKQRKMLLLLDNFEQVTVAAPAMAELLRDCPELKMLATSREALHVRGENVFPVPPLALPQVEAKHPALAQLAQSEAVQLFIERARAVKPDFQLTTENAQAVVEICVRLDGLPLAIELATARINVFTPQALSERLGNRLKLLRGGARDLPARQQTLRDTIDWSYELLDAGAQRLFESLAVFSGATLEAVEAVANRIKQFEELDLDIFDGVSSLADKSLIRQTEAAEGRVASADAGDDSRICHRAFGRGRGVRRGGAPRARDIFRRIYRESMGASHGIRDASARCTSLTVELENIRERRGTIGRRKEIWNSSASSPIVCGCSTMHAVGIMPRLNSPRTCFRFCPSPSLLRSARARKSFCRLARPRACWPPKVIPKRSSRPTPARWNFVERRGDTPVVPRAARTCVVLHSARGVREKGFRLASAFWNWRSASTMWICTSKDIWFWEKTSRRSDNAHLGLEHLEKAIAASIPIGNACGVSDSAAIRAWLSLNVSASVSVDDRFSGTRAQTCGRGPRARAKLEHPFSHVLCAVSSWFAQSVVGKCSSRASQWAGADGPCGET